METAISAIYEGGVLRPLEPVSLRESEVVMLSIHRDSKSSEERAGVDDKGRRHREAILDFIKKAEALPDNTPQDGFSNRDHDRLIYGE